MNDYLQDLLEGNLDTHQIADVERVNEVIQEQIAAKNQWFAHRFFPEALEHVIQARPDFVDEWVTDTLRDSPNARRRLQVGSAFFEALCEMLLKTDPKRGLKLYWHLRIIPMYVFTQDSNTGIRLLDYALFQIPATVDALATWEQGLEHCQTDRELLEVVIVAQCGQAQNWLWSYIERALQSDISLAHMRAITVLGFLDDESSVQRLAELQSQVPDTWIRELVRISLERQDRNTWAKHWFRRFLTAYDDTHAWAAFRLFLRCVDRRFWRWQIDVMAEVENLPLPGLSLLKLCKGANTRILEF